MLVIIPHPAEELKLINFQKDLIKNFNINGNVYYCHQPLWIELPFEELQANNKAELKILSKRIKNIVMENLQIKNEDIIIPVKVIFEDKEYRTELSLIHLYKKNDSESISPSLPSIPVSSLKIFRLALSIKLSENSQAITDFIWCKK